MFDWVMVAKPQAGTMPQAVVSLYGSGSDEGTGYASHLKVKSEVVIFKNGKE
jgi:hypothetical protein